MFRSVRNALERVDPRYRVLGYALALSGCGTALLINSPQATTTPQPAWSLPFIGLVVAFGLAESTALHVEIRKESHSLSLSSIPLLFGLLYLSPGLLVCAYILGSIPAMIWIRKSDLLKTAWNASLFFAEAALAGYIVRSALRQETPGDFTDWSIVLAAVLLAELLSLVAVPLVIMLVDVTFRPNLFADVGQSQILAALAGTFTITAASASLSDPLMLIYASVPLVGVGALLLSHGRLSQRYRDLQQLHRFTAALTNEQASRTLDTGLAELVQIMRSKNAGLLVTVSEHDDQPNLRCLIDDTFHDLDPEPVADTLLALARSHPATVLTAKDPLPGLTELLDSLQARDLVAVPILGETDRSGVLFVADRLGMARHFSPEELRLFSSLAQTLSARLSNEHLVGKLEAQAKHDGLTGLPNRLTFELALTATLSDPDSCGVVAMIDLDRFKEINDSLGHEMGDQLLIEIADRLKAGTRGTDMVARFGGDEFAVLLINHRTAQSPRPDSKSLEARVALLHQQLVVPVELDRIRFDIGASLGAVSWPQQGSDSEYLLRKADAAMYQAKRGQLGVTWYTPDLDNDAPRRSELYLSVGPALDNEEIDIAVQPKISTSTGEVTGAEALARWTHPKLGIISPMEFIPLITQAGLTGKLTRLVIRRAAAVAHSIHQTGLSVPIAVNLTARDLLDPALPDDIIEILNRAGVDPKLLVIEITEDATIVDFDTSVSVLTRIRDSGITVAIDDFGTGYSSLQHLHQLPVDQLKIDKSFVARLTTDSSAAAIIQAAINLGQNLNLITVAEGVEDHETLRRLTDLGCDEIQGYLISRPLDTTDFIKWIGDQTTANKNLRDKRTPIGDDTEHSWFEPLSSTTATCSIRGFSEF